MAGFSGDSSTVTAGSAPATTPGVFDPNAQTSVGVGGTQTYDPLGLPTGMGEQRIHVGYIPPMQKPIKLRRSHTVIGNEGEIGTTSIDELIKHYHDIATSGNQYSRAQWAKTQEQLAAMQAYNTKKINFGAWNNDDKNAIITALQGYMAGGDTSKLQTFEEYVAKTAAQAAANGLDQPAPPPPRAPLQMTNTADLNAGADTQSQQELGRAMSAGDQATFADVYHEQEQSAYDASGVGNGAAYQGAATVADAARQFVLDHNLPEYAQHQAESYMNVFANMFLTGSHARAHTSLGDAAVGGK